MKISTHGDNPSYVSFGKHRVYDTCLSLAIKNTNINVTNFDTEYKEEYKIFTLYPKGHIICSCCSKEKEISKHLPAYAVHYYSSKIVIEKLVYNGLICSSCKDTIMCMSGINIVKLTIFGGHLVIYKFGLREKFGDFTMRCIIRRWKKRASVKAALAKLRIYIMHWACKPNGPIYRLVINRLTSK